MKNKYLIINLFFALISPSIANAEINQEINYKPRDEESSPFISKQIINIENPEFIFDRGKCDVYENHRSSACVTPENAYQPNNKLDKYIIKGATYSTKFVPLMNDGAEGSEYTNIIANDGKRLLVDAGFDFVNSTANSAVSYTHLTLPTIYSV